MINSTFGNLKFGNTKMIEIKSLEKLRFLKQKRRDYLKSLASKVKGYSAAPKSSTRERFSFIKPGVFACFLEQFFHMLLNQEKYFFHLKLILSYQQENQTYHRV